LCRTCAIELQDLFDRYGTIHRGAAPNLEVEEDEGDDQGITEQISAIGDQYKMRLGRPINEKVAWADLRGHVDSLFSTCGVEQGYPWNGLDFEFNFLEYSSAAQTAKLSFRSATWPNNLPKNRYANILAPEHTRVILSTLKDSTGANIKDSDYINGNHVDSLKHKSRYMAVQGPLEHTADDFWRMVWEQNASCVVMVTREIESDRIKCAQYWTDGEDEYGDITLKMVGSTFEHDIIRRKFELRRGGKKRDLFHFQYVEWPDHGVPSSAKYFLEMVDAVNDPANNPSGGPIVVHCSAGIGRTGTFCTVHSILEAGYDEPVNVLSTILHFRNQRPGMVQTKDQLSFCYMALTERYALDKGLTRTVYVMADYDPTDIVDDQEALNQLDVRAGDELTMFHRRKDGWLLCQNEWMEYGYVSAFYIDKFRYADDYPKDEPIEVVDEDAPRVNVRGGGAPVEDDDPPPPPPDDGDISHFIEDAAMDGEGDAELSERAKQLTLDVVGTWHATQTQMNDDEPRDVTMSNIKQLRADGSFTNAVVDSVSHGRWRITGDTCRLVTVETSRKLVEELQIVSCDDETLVVASDEEPEFVVKLFYRRTDKDGSEEIKM